MEFSPRCGFTSEPPNDDREHKGVFPINYLHRHKNGCVVFFSSFNFSIILILFPLFLLKVWKFGRNLHSIFPLFFVSASNIHGRSEVVLAVSVWCFSAARSLTGT